MEYERLISCIQRYDHYYDSINNKAAVFLSLSIFVLGGLLAGYPTIIEKVDPSIYINYLMAALIIPGVGVIIMVVLASIPYFPASEESLLYFRSVGTMPLAKFEVDSAARAHEEELKDLRVQVYSLAKGLRKKFRRLRVAGILFLIQSILFIPFFFIIVTKLK